MKILSSEGLTFDDVLLVPQYSTIKSRFNNEINLSGSLTPQIRLTLPIISANMDTVTGTTMANAMEGEGGAGIIHRFMSIEDHSHALRLVRGKKILCIGVGETSRIRVSKVADQTAFDAVLIDIAHGACEEMVHQIQWTKEAAPHAEIIAGNVATYEGAIRLIEAGANSIKAGVGPGCFAGGTRILMSSGFYKNIEEVLPGDRVIGKDGEPTTVLGVKNSGIREVRSYRHPQFYKPTVCTPDHLHWVGDLNTVSYETLQSRGYASILDKRTKTTPKASRYKWKRIDELKQDVLLIPKSINFDLAESFRISLMKRSGGNSRTGCVYKEDCVLTPSYELGYIFGAFLGDGHANCNLYKGSHSGQIRWYFGRQENRIAEQVKKSILIALGKQAKVTECKNTLNVIFDYKPFADFMHTFGIKDQKHLPSHLLVRHEGYLRGLYDGLIDSDGSIEGYGRESFKNTSIPLVELFHILCLLVNKCHPSHQREEGSAGGLKGTENKNCLPSYKVRLGTLREKRQTLNYQVVQVLDRNNFSPPLYVQTYDIEVDNEDHSFIANNVIVHNSLCSTRIKTGNGVPQLTAIMEVSRAIAETQREVTLIADGGIRNSGDIVKALAAGADSVMVGSLFAGTDEAPGDLFQAADGSRHKAYRGMASAAAMQSWKGYVSSVEGEATTVPYKGSVTGIMRELKAGILSGMSYQNARSISELQHNAIFIRQTSHGYRESTPHGL